jgi:hypothetical protein
MLFIILKYFTKDTHKNKMIRIKQLFFLCFFSFIAAVIGCTIDFSLSDGGMDSGSDSDTDSDSDSDSDTDTDTDSGTDTDICTESNESTYGNYCYRSVTTLANFNAAESSCVAWRGHLASIASEQEKNYILAIISDLIWIGLHREVSDFIYTDGTPFTYNNWGNGEPKGEDCVQMTNLNQGKWVVEPCSNEYGYVCKRPL